MLISFFILILIIKKHKKNKNIELIYIRIQNYRKINRKIYQNIELEYRNSAYILF